MLKWKAYFNFKKGLRSTDQSLTYLKNEKVLKIWKKKKKIKERKKEKEKKRKEKKRKRKRKFFSDSLPYISAQWTTDLFKKMIS